jgi:hypothetical protein
MGLSQDDSEFTAKELRIPWPLLLLPAVVHVPLKLPGLSTQILASGHPRHGVLTEEKRNFI